MSRILCLFHYFTPLIPVCLFTSNTDNIKKNKTEIIQIFMRLRYYMMEVSEEFNEKNKYTCEIGINNDDGTMIG